MKHHYIYGYGMIGCLYDNGPNVASTLRQALDSLSFTFDELPKAELRRMRGNLRRDGIHYFCGRVVSPYEKGYMSMAQLAGAQMVEVSKHDGPAPDEDES